uniref:Uncharacterized protein n=1 Tax=Arundo donax TaxID=35708 RepID=A0A0A9BFA4_ARUDO
MWEDVEVEKSRKKLEFVEAKNCLYHAIYPKHLLHVSFTHYPLTICECSSIL